MKIHGGSPVRWSVFRAGLLTAVLVLVTALPAPAATGTDGQKLTVSRATELAPAGTTVQVKGSGYDDAKGIYVALCFDQGPGKVPTPCLGGVDTSGASGASAWISSNPPSYGKDLAKPFGPGGSFSVSLRVAAVDAVMGFDCRDPKAHPETASSSGCAIVTRADHTRTSDRSSDVKVPVGFTGKPASGGGSGSVPDDDGSGSGGAGNAGGTGDSKPASTAGTSAGGAPVAAAGSGPKLASGAPAARGTVAPVPESTLANGVISQDGTALAGLPVSSDPVTTQLRTFVAVSVAAGLLLLGSIWLRRRRSRRA
jgi:hypothetical protein